MHPLIMITQVLQRLARALVPLLVAALAGCSWFGIELGQTDQTAKWDADKLYAEARLELANGSWAKARELYQKLESRYPFGRHAQQALMEIAYSYYKEGETAQAIQTADRFIRQYPNHPNIDYVYYLKGLASFNEDLGFLAKLMSQEISERDAKAAREAFDAFKDLVTRYPESKYAEDARARMRYLVNAQAQAEVNVARFYFMRKAYIAAIQRAQVVLRDYQRTPATEEALHLMARSYAALQMNDLQADAERVLALNFPQSRYLSSR
jgi:outer membrane protein assembly factor BamD